MPDFSSYKQAVENVFNLATKGFFSKLDRFTYKMLIDNLKGTDYEQVAGCIDQIVKEKRSTGIPPLYVVAKAHPFVRVRQKAKEALTIMDPDKEVDALTKGKSMEEAVKLLVERFGHYKG